MTSPSTAVPGRGLKRVLLVAAKATVLLTALVAFLNAYVLVTTSGATSQEVATTPAHAYAIVLGGGVGPDGVPSHELAERLATVRALYVHGRVRRIIASGRTTGAYSEPRAMAAWLTSQGVAPADVIVDGAGYRTAASLANAAKLGIGSILIVSQGYHLPRAIYLARHAGLSAAGLAAPFRPLDATSGAYHVVREIAARAEAVLEVTFRGVRS